MSNFEPSNIKYLDVRTLEFAIHSPRFKGEILESNDIQMFTYKAGYKLGLNEMEDIARLVLEIDVHGQIQGGRAPKKLGTIITVSFFYLLDFKDWLLEEFDETSGPPVRLKETMVNILVGLAYSTTRGILRARSAGTIIEHNILPVIAPSKLRELQEIDAQPT
jgi:hypothetical protein